MAFYVPVGPRGAIFRFGTFLIGVLGGASYWWASLRRTPIAPALSIALEAAES